MLEQERIIKLINTIEELFDYDDIDDITMTSDYDNNLKLFSKKLYEIFNTKLTNEELDMISKIDKIEIFYCDMVEEYKNNEIRKQIVQYLDTKPLYFDFNLVKKYIKDNYKLAKYIKDKDKILELLDLNEKVILVMDSKYLTENLILKQMKKSNFITEIFLGMHENNDIYEFSMFYKNNNEINSLLYEQALNYLKEDIYKIIHSSDLVKNNNDIAKFVLSIDPKFKVYLNK